jgi:hypothetical protein
VVDIDTSTPARERLVEGLLGWGQPRPRAPAGLATHLLGMLERGLAELQPALGELAAARRGRRLLVSKTTLDRLTCDGLQLAPKPYEHSAANVRGVLAHEAIAADWERGRSQDPDTLVASVWHDAASRRAGDPRSLSAWINGLSGAEADALRAEVSDLVNAFREVWPPLPPEVVRLRIERPIEVPLAGRAVVLRGVPDLIVDSRRSDDRARALVVDLKTGRPRSEHDRHELRFYALLSALRDGRPPFRWATFYVTEGRSEPEELRRETLESTVQRVLDTVRQLVRLDGVAPDAPEEGLRLVAGLGCYSCLRRPGCSVAAAELGEMSHGHGTIHP